MWGNREDRMLVRESMQVIESAKRLSDRMDTSVLEIEELLKRSRRLIRECREMLDNYDSYAAGRPRPHRPE